MRKKDDLKIMRETLHTRFISSLEKCRANDNFDDKKEIKRLSLMKNEHRSVQLLIRESDISVATRLLAKVKVESELSGCINISNVEQVYVPMPIARGGGDENYISKEPGLFPDLLTPLRYGNSAIIPPGELRCLWFDIKPDGK